MATEKLNRMANRPTGRKLPKRMGKKARLFGLRKASLTKMLRGRRPSLKHPWMRKVVTNKEPGKKVERLTVRKHHKKVKSRAWINSWTLKLSLRAS